MEAAVHKGAGYAKSLHGASVEVRLAKLLQEALGTVICSGFEHQFLLV